MTLMSRVQKEYKLANRVFNKRQSLEREVKDLYAKVAIGGTGAPTLTTGYGLASIVRNGAGDYTVTLSDKYSSLKHFEAIHLSSSAQDLQFQLHSEDVIGAKTIRFLCLTGATPTDPASGKVLLLKIEVKNTSVI
jgi:hypothetical protein